MKLVKLLILFSILLSCTLPLQAQFNINTNPFWEGEIKMEDGTIHKGYIQVPNNTSQKKVVYKTSLKGETLKVKRKKIDYVQVTSNTGKAYRYENIPVVMTIKGNSSLGTQLLLVEAKNNYATFYIVHGVYKVNKREGEIELLYRFRYGKDFPVTSHYIRKRNQKKARQFAVTKDLKGIKKAANYHLTEDEALLEKINAGDLTEDDITEIITIYLKTTENL